MASSYFDGWKNYVRLLIPASIVSTTETDQFYPVKLSAEVLAVVHAVLGSGLTNRKNCAFTSDADAYYYAEIKEWATGTFLLKIPSLSTSVDNYFKYYFGGNDGSAYIGDAGDAAAQSVYDSNTKNVYNFEQDPTGGAGSIIDSKGSKDGTPYGSMTSDDLVAGQFGNALDFDGDDYVSFGTGVIGLTGDFTIGFITTPVPSTGHKRIIGKMTGLDGFLVTREGETGRLDFAFYDGTTWRDLWVYSEVLPDDTETNVFLTYDGSNIRLYIDGSEIIADSFPFAFTGSLNDSTQELRVASSFYADGKYPGTVGHLSFSDTARSANWINLFALGISGNLITFGEVKQIINGLQTSRNILADVIPGIQTVTNLLGNLQAVRTIENLIGNIFDIQTILTSSGLAGVQTSQNSFSEKLTGLQSVMMRLTDDLKSGQQTISNSLISEIYGVQTSINLIAEGLTGIQPVRNLISGDGIEGVHTVQNTIDLKDVIHGLQSIIFSMEEVKPIIFSVSQAQNPGEGVAISGPIIPPGASGIAIAIFLDGKNITQKVDKPAISISQDSIHNTITMTSINQELWAQSDPELNPGAVRIVFQIGTRQMEFLLEERDGDYKSFRMWGRSASAKDSAQYVENIIYSASDRKSAKETAEGFLVNLVIDWEVCDWLLPDGYEYEGDPVDGVQAIAGIIGAVVRTQDDGNLTVRYRNPIRPYDVPNQSPVARYNTNNEVFSISYKNEKGLNYQGVEVFGDARDLPAPDLEVLESDLMRGEVCHIKAYFLTENTPDLEMLLTAGTIRYIGEYEEKIEDVDVTFQEYTSTVSKPILGIKGIEWIGDIRGGIISFEPYQKEFTCEEQYAICKLSYVTKYRKYEVANHDVEKLLAVFSSVGYPDISVKVILNDVENPIMAPAIVDENLTNQEAAVAVGKNYIDDTIYDKTVFSFESPYNEACMDGEIVYIQSDREHFAGNVMVKNAPISFDGVKITQSIEAVRWLV